MTTSALVATIAAVLIVDAHEDIACNAITFGRNYTTSAYHICAAEPASQTPVQNGHACLGRTEWLSGRMSVVIASLPNPRYAAEWSAPERALSDDQIRKMAAREDVIGIIPYNRFLKTGSWPPGGRHDVSVNHVAEIVDYICQLTGRSRHVGIGSDFDGGCRAEVIPHPIGSVADLHMIGAALSKLGYNSSKVTQILFRKWLAALRRGLPD